MPDKRVYLAIQVTDSTGEYDSISTHAAGLAIGLRDVIHFLRAQFVINNPDADDAEFLAFVAHTIGYDFESDPSENSPWDTLFDAVNRQHADPGADREPQSSGPDGPASHW